METTWGRQDLAILEALQKTPLQDVDFTQVLYV